MKDWLPLPVPMKVAANKEEVAANEAYLFSFNICNKHPIYTI